MVAAVVTGASGFIGQNLIKKLSQKKRVLGLLHREEHHYADLYINDNIEYITCDNSLLSQLKDLIPDRNYDSFFHLSWDCSSGPGRGDAGRQLDNVQSAIGAVSAAKKIGCSRFIGAGTIAETFCHSIFAIDGSCPDATNNYGAAKIAAHYMSKIECCKLGLDHLWPYIPNTFGIGNRTSNFFNFAAGLMLSGKRAAFTDATQAYDLVHIDDVINGLIKIEENGRSNHNYYIGSGSPRPLKEYIIMIRDYIDSDIELHFGEIDFKGVMLNERNFNCDKLIQDTGYQPKISFEDGLQEAINWLKAELYS